jgi:acylphosphatase
VTPLYLRISGRVQGVGFRWFVRQAADRLRLAGWVRNCPDGTVEIAVDGPADAQQQLVTVVRRGPPGADVTAVEHLHAPRIDQPIGNLFRVVR